MCVYHLGLNQSWITKGNHIPKAPLILMLDMVKTKQNKTKQHIPGHLIGFPTLSEDSHNRMLIKKANQVLRGEI